MTITATIPGPGWLSRSPAPRRGTAPGVLERLAFRAEARRGEPDDQLVVIFADGHENDSREFTHKRLFRRINRVRSQAWTFVFAVPTKTATQSVENS